MSKYYISQETASVYWLDDGLLWACPIDKTNTFDTSEGYIIDSYAGPYEMTKSPYDDGEITFAEFWEYVRNKLI